MRLCARERRVKLNFNLHTMQSRARTERWLTHKCGRRRSNGPPSAHEFVVRMPASVRACVPGPASVPACWRYTTNIVEKSAWGHQRAASQSLSLSRLSTRVKTRDAYALCQTRNGAHAHACVLCVRINHPHMMGSTLTCAAAVRGSIIRDRTITKYESSVGDLRIICYILIHLKDESNVTHQEPNSTKHSLVARFGWPAASCPTTIVFELSPHPAVLQL